ncbi:MAG: hypothetical protein AVDCRST_MAG93-5042, partial [uncultured Chloroflexia bacterium]
ARLQAGGLGGPDHPWARVHPEPAQRLLHAHCTAATSVARHDRMVAVAPGDL